MSPHVCPYCGSANIQHGITPFQHALRLMFGSPKRYCLDCNKMDA